MNLTNRAKESKLAEQFADFIDLTDDLLEEINLSDLGRIQGGSHWGSCSCGGFDFINVSSHSFAGSCSCSSCSCSCEGFGFGSCSCEGFGFGSCSCGDFWG